MAPVSRAPAREANPEPVQGDPGNQARLEAIAAGATGAVPDRSRFEQAFGADFGSVRAVLGGPEASGALDALGANAAAIGDRLLFRETSPEPALVGHELAHVLQQEAVPGSVSGARAPSPEDEARDLGARAAAGEPVTVRAAATAGAAQFDLRDKVSDQRDKRGVDTPAGPDAERRATFVDHDDAAPVMHHDHGFLEGADGTVDDSLREEPTWDDRMSLAAWIAKLEVAEVLRPDLVDGTSAYRHFLEGGGATRTLDYERFVQGDSSGATVMASAQEDAEHAAIARHDQMIAGRDPTPGTESFRMRSGVIPVGGGGRYPYPATENWQKAIGAHQLWLEMDVTVETYEVSRTEPSVDAGVPAGIPEGGVCVPEGDTVVVYGRRFEVDLTVHMEDMYNFNPGAADIATGTPDADNGRFEITGLGHEYLNQATARRSLGFEATMDPVAAPGSGDLPTTDPGRTPRTDRRPDGARRANPGVR